MKYIIKSKIINILMAIMFSVSFGSLVAQEEGQSMEGAVENEQPAEAEEQLIEAEEQLIEEAPAEENAATEGEQPIEEAPAEESATVETQSTEETTQASGDVYSDGKRTYATSATKFSLDSQDQLSALKRVEFKVDEGAFQRYEEPISIEKEGVHRILFRGIDNVENIEAESIYVVVIDNTAPEVSVITEPVIVLEKSRRAFGPANLAVELRSVDNYSGIKKVEYSLDSGAYQDYTGPITLTEAGYHQIKYKAIDNLGNETTERSVNLEIDNTAPKVMIIPEKKVVKSGEQNFTARDNSFEIDVIDEDSGVERIMVKVDGDADFRPYTNPIRFSVEGNHTIEAKAVDKVGNQSEIQRLEIIVDDNPPKTTITPVSK
ncbi:MAG: hypothetical protein OEZ13_02745 [Spirochaetia bacterium]|nr:hypothetical protein [Spirochaetia bacterium]